MPADPSPNTIQLPVATTAPALRPTGQDKIAFAHTLRAVAALTVMVGHLGLSFWANPPGIENVIGIPVPASATPMPAPARFLSQLFTIELCPGVPFLFGPFGVGLFFLISGFVIPFSFRRQSRLGFLAGRAIRLWPTYAAGLTIAIVAIGVGTATAGRPFPFPRNVVLPQYVIGLRDLMWLPSIDGIVWTLEIEVRFYLLCALVAPWLAAGRLRIFYVVAPALALASAVCVHKYPKVLAEHPEWHPLCWAAVLNGREILLMLCGTAFHYLYRGRIGKAHAAVLVSGLFGLTLAVRWFDVTTVGSAAKAANDGLAVVAFAACYALRGWFKGRGVLGWFADISYPLYVVHAVLGYTMMALLLRAGVPATLVWFAGIGVTVLAAWLLHRLIERPTHRLASDIARKLSGAPAAVVPAEGISARRAAA